MIQTNMTVVTVDGRFEFLFSDTENKAIHEFVRMQLSEGKNVKVFSIEVREVGREDITEEYAQGYEENEEKDCGASDGNSLCF